MTEIEENSIIRTKHSNIIGMVLGFHSYHGDDTYVTILVLTETYDVDLGYQAEYEIGDIELCEEIDEPQKTQLQHSLEKARKLLNALEAVKEKFGEREMEIGDFHNIGLITLVLPEPPSSNRYWRKYNNRMVLSQEAQDYKNQVIMLCAGLEPLQGEIEITIKWYRKRRQGDLDNRIKIILDCLQWRLYENDSKIVALHAYRYEDKANPRVEISACTFRETDLH